MKTTFLSSFLFVIALISLSFFGGYCYRQKEVLDSAKHLLNNEKISYNFRDIELIIYNKEQNQTNIRNHSLQGGFFVPKN